MISGIICILVDSFFAEPLFSFGLQYTETIDAESNFEHR